MRHLLSLLLFSSLLYAEHSVLTCGKGKLAMVDAQGKITWEMKWGGIHDIHQLPNGNILVQRRMRELCEIDPKTKAVVWSYDSSKMNG